MAVTREIMEDLIFGGEGFRNRFTQDSPILPDVWIEYALKGWKRHAVDGKLVPGDRPDVLIKPAWFDDTAAMDLLAWDLQRPVDLLLTPKRNINAADLCAELRRRLEESDGAERPRTDRRLENLAEQVDGKGKGTGGGGTGRPVRRGRLESAMPLMYNESCVVAELWYDELIRVALPLTNWWHEHILARPRRVKLKDLVKDEAARRAVEGAISGCVANGGMADERAANELLADERSFDLLWLIQVAGRVQWEFEQHPYRIRAEYQAQPDQALPPPAKPPPKKRGRAKHTGKGLTGDPQGTGPPTAPVREPAGEPPDKPSCKDLVDAFCRLIKGMDLDELPERPLLWSVNRNRLVSMAVWRSVKSTKADAAIRLFNLSCADLCWAVVDSGIDATHPAFRKRDPTPARPAPRALGQAGRGDREARDTGGEGDGGDEDEAEDLSSSDAARITDAFTAPGPSSVERREYNRTRVRATYDFTRLRKLLTVKLSPSVRAANPAADRETAVEKSGDAKATDANADDVKTADLAKTSQGQRDEIEDVFATLSDREKQRVIEAQVGLRSGRMIDWHAVEPFLRVPHQPGAYRIPQNEHGTHVAGILAGDWRTGDWRTGDRPPPDEEVDLLGVCPDLILYDLRVLDDRGVGDEFSVLAALQFVRWLNANKDEPMIHGVNISMSLLHDVTNFACGRTPICDECDRLVSSGVVVVAAAGNEGYAQFTTPRGPKDGYRSISITDPGNAESVITVGATHRFKPHTYGVSYFSSRGPTGDGRNKPDLVAPGEKIKSTVPRGQAKSLDGTSMAAPHVSGAAALLLARHREMIGQPWKVKQVLCKTATDLGRERFFQGAGMLDVLRALQSV